MIFALLAIAAAILFILLVFWLWGIIHCLTSKLTLRQKTVWILSLIIMPILANILYILFVKYGDEYNE